MNSKWPKMTLREAGVSLIDCVHKTPSASDDGYPYVAIPQLSQGRINITDARRISEEDFREWTKKASPEPNDVVLSRRCNPGETAYVADGMEFALGQNLVLLRSDGTRVYPPYLRWMVRGPEWWEQISKFLNVGAVFDSLKCADVPEFVLSVPPLPEQRAIAHILGTLDDKIELNRRMNETLEAVARALFKSWFVDFDPVRAKAEGRWKPGQSLPGLPAHLYDLFPERLVDSELGEIPDGWHVRTIEEVAERVAMGPFGASIKVETFVSDGVPIISGQHLRGLMLEDSTFNFITDDHATKLANANVRRGDVIFTHAGSIGQAAFVPYTSQYESYVISQRQFYMRCDLSQVNPIFIALYFNSHEGRHRLLANTSSSGVPSIARPVTYLRTIPLSVPSKSVMDAFESAVSPILQQCLVDIQTSNTLAVLRDALLPKLISGVLSVKNVERFVGTPDRFGVMQ